MSSSHVVGCQHVLAAPRARALRGQRTGQGEDEEREAERAHRRIIARWIEA
jgi:hypothetical protein